jgi:2'-5' RNA ligase
MKLLGDPWPVPHITLKAPDGLTPDLSWLAKARDIAARTPRFDVTIGAPRTFGTRVLYLSVEGSALEHLHRELAKIVSHADGVEHNSSDSRSFTPHLTLSVAHEGLGVPPIGSWAATLHELETFEVTELTVFRRDVPSTHYQLWATLPLSSRSA